MGIKLESIEIKNIRSHSYFLFKPKEDGITVIAGENGTGKSTIVNSLAWTLFSTKPKGLGRAQSMMKEGVPFSKDSFFSEVILQLEDEYLKVRKTIKNKTGSAECMVWTSSDMQDWVERSGPAITSAEPYIRKRLQMDEKEFLASVLIQQKEVDSLILADPKKRAQIIEKLTGISSITEAVNIARTEYKQLQKTIGDTNINEEGLEKLKKVKKENDSKISGLETKYKKSLREIEKLTVEKDAMKQKVEEAESERDTINELENKNNLLTAKIEDKKNLLNSLLIDKDKKKEQFSKITKNYNTEELLKKIDLAEQELNKVNNIISSNSFNINLLKEKELEHRQVLEKSKISDIKTAKMQETNNSQNLKKLELQDKKLEQDKYSFIGLCETLDNAIKTIETHGGECPTCMQKVSDVKSTVENLNEQKRNAKTNISEIDEKIKKNKMLKVKLNENMEKFKLLIEAFDVDNITKEIEALEKALAVNEAEKYSITKEIMSIRKLYAESENYDSIKKEYTILLERAQEETVALESIEAELLKVNQILKKSKMPSTNEINKNRTKLDSLINNLSLKRENLIKIESSINLEKEKNSNLNKEIVQLEEDLSKYKKLLGSVENSLNTVKLLEEFRIDRIKSSSAIIETYASEFLSKFTDNMFSGMKLDSNFNASVLLPNGTSRDIGLLSGGEVSAAAIALRFAIAFLLSSDDDKNLLILDEVLAAQDVNRVQTILDSIKETLKGQVILIAHNDSIKSIADKVVELS